MSAALVLEALGAGTLPALISEVSRRAATRRRDRQEAAKLGQAAKVEQTRVDAAAYGRAQEINDRAQEINDSIVRALREEIDRLQRELADMRRLLHESQQRSDELERKVADLQRTVDRMSRLLREHDIDPEGL